MALMLVCWIQQDYSCSCDEQQSPSLCKIPHASDCSLGCSDHTSLYSSCWHASFSLASVPRGGGGDHGEKEKLTVVDEDN